MVCYMSIWVCYTVVDMPGVVWHIRPCDVWYIFGVFTMIKFHTIICCGNVNSQYIIKITPPDGRVVRRENFGHFKIVLFPKVQVGAHLVFFKIWYTDLYSWFFVLSMFIMYSVVWAVVFFLSFPLSSYGTAHHYICKNSNNIHHIAVRWYTCIYALYRCAIRWWICLVWYGIPDRAVFDVFSCILQWLYFTP